MPTPPISVCMPVYDAETFVDRAIASIRAQSFADFEFVIVDDGSRDATAALAAMPPPICTQSRAGTLLGAGGTCGTR